MAPMTHAILQLLSCEQKQAFFKHSFIWGMPELAWAGHAQGVDTNGETTGGF